MYKILMRRFILLSCSLFFVFGFIIFQIPQVKAAATPTVTIIKPTVNGAGVGHAGTPSEISGTGFPAGTVNLYTTTISDPQKCVPGATQGLTPFKGAPTATVQADGTFDVQVPWPDTASTALTSYYVCALTPKVGALSGNSLTIPPPTKLIITPPKVAIGRAFFLTGMNWLPPQPLKISITSPAATTPIISQMVDSDTAGNFQVKIVIPATAVPGIYSIQTTAQNEPTLTQTVANGLTIVSAASISGTPANTDGTGTPNAQTTTIANPVATPRTTSDNANNNNFLIILLVVIVIVLILIGLVLFRHYSSSNKNDGNDPKNPGPPGGPGSPGAMRNPGQPDAFAGTNRPGNPNSLANQQRQNGLYGQGSKPGGSNPSNSLYPGNNPNWGSPNVPNAPQPQSNPNWSGNGGYDQPTYPNQPNPQWPDQQNYQR
ncbi:MAG TPA: hypothetical protein VFN23_03620 [Ktedonobacteraceae bacterium]|nr:hypothetical protein [Ktedonobacteraceae bacterium]